MADPGTSGNRTCDVFGTTRGACGSGSSPRAAAADFQQLLVDTSRTFALAIPLLEEPLRHQMTLAYLLFRVADTLEDADRLLVSDRREWLLQFRETLATRDTKRAASLSARYAEKPPVEHQGYLRLLAELPALFDAVQQLEPTARDVVCEHAGRTMEGMAEFLSSCGKDDKLVLTTLDQLRQYCYVVAGIVGEMITELFLTYGNEVLAESAAELRRRARWFGEGLQLVNILKDITADAQSGRCYVPAGVGRAELLQLARADLDEADAYVAALRRANAPDGMLPFTELPIQLARKTLDLIERDGPGAKLSRKEVASVLAEITAG